MKKNNKRNPYDVHKIDSFLYWLAVHAVKLWFRLFYGLKINNAEVRGLKAPFLLLSNHESNYDFLMDAIALYPNKLHIMVTTYFFHHALLGRLLEHMGCIPKRQFVPDTKAIKSVLRIIERGENVCIFPEGQTCYTGETCDFDESTAKLVKKLCVPVVASTVRGNHLAFPKWAPGKKFPARCEVYARVILTAKEISELSAEEIYTILKRELSYNDFEWQRGVMAKSRKPRTTSGLQNILYRCVNCKADFSMTSDGKNRLVCSKCGYTAELDDYGFLHAVNGETVTDNCAAWFNLQRAAINAEIDAGALPFSSPCRLMRTIEGKQGYFDCGEGTVTLDGTGIHFNGVRDGEPFSVEALYERQSALPHNCTFWAIDIHGEGENYALAPDDPRKMIKFVESYLIMRKRTDAQKKAVSRTEL